MKSRKIRLLCLCLAVTSLAMSGCKKAEPTSNNSKTTAETAAITTNDKGPVTDTKITLKAIVNKDALHGSFKDMPVVKDLEAETNVHIEWEEVPSNAVKEKVNLVFASNDLPDFFGNCVTDADLMKYGGSSLIELDKLIDKNAPNLKKLFTTDPALKNFITLPNGHIYSMPYKDAGITANYNPDNVFMNKVWLDKLGLKVPTTTDEFYNVLKAFKEKDPNGNGKADEIPFSAIINNNNINSGIYSFYGAFGVLDGVNHLMVQNGKVVFTPTTDGYKEGTLYFAKLYKDGLLDPESFTQDRNQYFAKGKASTAILGTGLLWLDENLLGVERARKEYTAMLPLKGPKGDQLWNKYNNDGNRNTIAITSANKYPDITVRLMDRLYIERWSAQTQRGHLGTVIKEEGTKYVAQTPPQGVSVDEFRFKSSPVNCLPFYIPAGFYDTKFALTEDAVRKEARVKEYSKYFPKEILPALFFTQDQSSELATLTNDIGNYVAQMQAKWIIGTSSIDKDWEDYVKNLEKMNLKRYIQLYQEALDTYKKNAK